MALLFPSWKMGFRQANRDWLSTTNLDLHEVRAFLFTGPSSGIVPNVSIASAFPVTFRWRLNVARCSRIERYFWLVRYCFGRPDLIVRFEFVRGTGSHDPRVSPNRSSLIKLSAPRRLNAGLLFQRYKPTAKIFDFPASLSLRPVLLARRINPELPNKSPIRGGEERCGDHDNREHCERTASVYYSSSSLRPQCSAHR